MTQILSRPPGPSTGASAARSVWPGLVLALVLLGQFMAILDVSIVNVAAPTIRADLGASGSGLQLVIAGYTISYAVLLITGARLGDRLGHRAVFHIGLSLFTAASLACGLAGDTAWLVTFRLVQGAGAALLVPQVLSIIQRTFTGPARAKALSVYATVIAGGVVVGQVLGGALVSADLAGLQWRPIFLVNVPVGVGLLLAGTRWLPRDRGEGRRGHDLLGLVTLAASVLLLVVPLVLGHEQDWPLWGWASMGASVAVFGVFVAVEAALTRRGGQPLIPGRVLRAPGMWPAVTVIFLGMATYGGFLFALALHLQGGLGYSALRAGLTFVPGALGFALASLYWRRLPVSCHRPIVPIGYTVTALGYAALAWAVRGAGQGELLLAIMLAVVGLGLGAAFSPSLAIALSTVDSADAADASGLLATMTQLGQVVGVAAFGTLFLTLATHPGTHPSAHAEAVTAVVLAITAAVAAVCGITFTRRPTP